MGLVEAILKALDEEEVRFATQTGRASAENYLERVGVSKGLRRAGEIVRETVKRANKEEGDG